MNIGLSSTFKTKEWSNEKLTETLHALDIAVIQLEERESAYMNLFDLKRLCDRGRQDIAKFIAGEEVSSESLATLIASEEDFWSKAGATAMAAADIGTLGYAGNIKQIVEMCMETTQQLSKKLNKNLRRLKGRKITDADIADVRAATLRPFNSWMFRAQVIMKITAEFRSITVKNAFDKMKKIAEMCAQLGWRPRGLFAFTGIHMQSTGSFLKDRWSVSNDKAGKLGWTSANLQKAIPIAQKLLDIRYGDIYVGNNPILNPKDQVAVAELNKAGMTFKQINKALTAVSVAAYHEVGKMVRGLNKLLTAIDADYDEDDDY